MPAEQAEQWRMYQSTPDFPIHGSVDGAPPGDIPRTLDVIETCLKLLDEGVDRLNPVLAVAVYRDDALVSLVDPKLSRPPSLEFHDHWRIIFIGAMPASADLTGAPSIDTILYRPRDETPMTVR